jgi:Neurotransmitter-gated ion-channel ligand binding domain
VYGTLLFTAFFTSKLIRRHLLCPRIQDYSVSMYLRQTWKDPRLAFDATEWPYDQVRLGIDSWSAIWTPDTFFRNEKSASFHSVTLDNRLLRLNRNGTLWYVIK